MRATLAASWFGAVVFVVSACGGDGDPPAPPDLTGGGTATGGVPGTAGTGGNVGGMGGSGLPVAGTGGRGSGGTVGGSGGTPGTAGNTAITGGTGGGPGGSGGTGQDAPIQPALDASKDAPPIADVSQGGGMDAAPMCIAAGGACTQTGTCCGAFAPCIQGTCAAPCTSNGGCISGCCLQGTTSRFCAPADLCAPIGGADGGANLDSGVGGSTIVRPAGCGRVIVRADDARPPQPGQFLGVATGNRYASEGVCNEYGNYGSRYSSTSIFNPYSNYGSAYASHSAFNPYTSTPPFLQCEDSGAKLNAISKNRYVPGSPIDPDKLCALLADMGW